MRHRIYGKHLGRNEGQRQALFKTLVQSLFVYGTIQTSETKAKSIKGLVDKIINSAKDKNTQGRFKSYISNKNLQDRLIKEILPKLGTRSSGYTQLVRMGSRQGDQTTMVKMSLIGVEGLKPLKKESKSHEEPKMSEVKNKEPEVGVTEKKVVVAKKSIKAKNTKLLQGKKK